MPGATPERVRLVSTYLSNTAFRNQYCHRWARAGGGRERPPGANSGALMGGYVAAPGADAT